MKVVRDVDRKTWNEFLAALPEANAHQTPEMRDVFALTKNYEPILLATEEDGELQQLLLACVIKEGGGLKGTFSSRAIVTGGPLSRTGELGFIVKAFDDVIAPKALYAQFRNLWDMSSRWHAFEGLGYTYEEHLNYVHDLTRKPPEIWAGFSEGRQKGIRKAEGRGIEAKEGEEEDIDTFYELVFDTYRDAKIPFADRSLFKAAWRVMKPKGMVRMVLAFMKGNVLAGRMVLTYHGTIHDWYAGSVAAARKENANELLVWSLLKWGSSRGYKSFDFGGAGKPGEHYGPGEFKRRFGGQETRFGRFQKVYHPIKHKVGEKGYRLLKKLG